MHILVHPTRRSGCSGAGVAQGRVVGNIFKRARGLQGAWGKREKLMNS